jgi:pimeloyl-ACP methyl ester carboxylesterase
MPSLFDSPAFNDSLFFPRADTTVPPAGASDHEVAVPGATLHLRWHRAAHALPTLLLFHGNGETVSDYDDAAPRYAAAGTNLAVVDFRGYGRSTGEPTLRNTIADAPLVLNALCALTGTSVYVMGRSIGSVCAAEIYGHATPFLGLVWESGLCDLRALVGRRGLVPPEHLADDDLAAFDPLPKLRRGSRPLLVLHGTRDEIIAPIEAQQVFDAAGTAHERLVYLPGRGHNDVSGAREYWDALAELVRT